jgi:hypothetical protein
MNHGSSRSHEEDEDREDRLFKSQKDFVCFVVLRVFVMSRDCYERTCPVHAG